MNHHNLSRLATATTACLSIVLCIHLFQPLHGAKSTPSKPRRLPPLTTPIPTAPAIPQEEPKEAKQPVRQQSHVKKDPKTTTGKESKQAKKQATVPTTRNLIMIFDAGADAGAMIDKFATALQQQCAFIIITQQLWERFKTTPAKTIFTKAWAPDPEDDTLSKVLGNQTCADILFTPNQWNVYAADGQAANKQDRLYVFMPHQYVKTTLGNAKQDNDLGLNISTLALVKDPLSTAETKTASELNYEQGNVVADALNQILCQTSTHPWNVYCIGHGSKGDRNTGKIVGLSIPTFESITLFFNTKVRTNFFFYDTCFAGGKHLTTPFTIEKAPVRLSYPIAAGSISDAPTSSQMVLLGSWEERPGLPIKIPMETISKAVGKPIHLFAGINFPTFFNGLEAFASGISDSMDLIRTLNTVSGFLTPDLQKVAFLENMPHICMPGADSFQIIRLSNELPLINLTHALINAKNIDSLRNNQPWEIDVTGDNIVLLQTSDIAIPLIINTGTKLVPLMPTIPFLHATSKTPKELEHQHLVTFTAPLIAHMGLFVTLSSLWYLPKQIQLTNTMLLIDTLICGNDLEESQQKIVSKKIALQLKRVMIYINTPNPFSPNAHNTALFTCDKRAFFIDMDQLVAPLSPLSPEAAHQYQAMYEQYRSYCIDDRLKTLREKNEKNLGLYTITKATKALEFMKKELQVRREKRVQELKTHILEATQKEFLSNDITKSAAALTRCKNFITKDVTFAFPILIETASAGIFSPHKNVQKNSLSLFEALLMKNQGVPQAIDTALKGEISNDAATRKNANTLFMIIFFQEKNLAYTISMAQAGIRSSDEDTRNTALTLFNVFFAQGHGFDEALSAVNHNIIAAEPYVRQGALELLKALFKENKDYMPAQTIIKRLEETKDPRGNRQMLKDLKNVLMWKAAKVLTHQADTAAITEPEEEAFTSAASSPRQPSGPLTSPLTSPKGRQVIAPPTSAVTSPTAQQIIVTTPTTQPQQDESWICPNCDTENKAAEAICIECKEPKPSDS